MDKKKLIQLLRGEEETLLIELLDITSEEIVDAFLDKVNDRIDYLYGQYEEKEHDE